MDWLEVAAWVLAVVPAVPLAVLAVECFAALRRTRPAAPPDPAARPRCAVLIPAHDEEAVIHRTLLAVAAQLGPADRVLVVADNCTDGTAAVARSHGAAVVERSDPARRGKGYALAFGRDALRSDPPDVVVVLDADCTLGDHALSLVAAEAAARRRPAQAAYRMVAPPRSGPNRRVAAFAFLVKNVVRPTGLRRLGRPCLLTGSGMAFPWAVIEDAPLGHGHIVEDLGLTVDLAMAGRTAVFVPGAEIRGEFPVDDRAAGSQRRRWEHGHLRVMTTGVPRLLGAGLARGRLDLAVLALEVGVPPLSGLVLVAAVALAGLGLWAAAGGPAGPAATLGACAAAAGLGLAAAWWRYGRDTLPAKIVVQIPLYIIKKLPLYFGFFRKPQRDWIRTARESSPDAVDHG